MFILRDSNRDEVYEVGKPNRFPDGTLAIGYVPDYHNEILWLYDSDEEFFTLMCLRNHLKEENIRLIMPYIPHARMDRTEDEEVFTLKTFCQTINSMKFSEVVVLDPHSNVSTALLDRVRIISPVHYIGQSIDWISNWHNNRDDIILFFPDEGAMKRYSKMFPGFPYAFGIKDRDWKTGKIKGLQICNAELVKDKKVLIVDDICSRGGTFYHASHALQSAGARDMYLYVSHCENTILEGDMYKEDLIKRVFTTDSIFRGESSKIDTIYTFEEGFLYGEIF